ncbi:restriction endonuclease [Rhizobium indicum]|uniref:Restriction endonuclease n=1 Tax=Rhizobium indicum TaxID=2583231 RepID=A0ABX6PB66_9HYPH|nr:restriction endonuclease [Rhizobium indicum]QKK15611.1 restriction endonuclease [Rhizobium indicum]
MSKAGYTRTINPLQFSALEPKRFEDLVRQLLYEFRTWRQLEATGRSGSDDGFDARGWEVYSPFPADLEDEEPETQDRVWLIQCKRERSIGPAKLIKYLNDIPEEEREKIYGIILCAPTDFSKTSRDKFRLWCNDKGISECHLWGEAELEDALFSPRNDHLLFAYFGLSLQIRRRSEQARLRARTTIKRKLKRAFVGKNDVLIRAADDDQYPYSHGREDFRWWVYSAPQLTHSGLRLQWRRHYAYLNLETNEWDCANGFNSDLNMRHGDPWRGSIERTAEENSLWEVWYGIPEAQRALISVAGIIPFDSILEVDEIGDEITDHPHIFVTLEANCTHPFLDCLVEPSYFNSHLAVDIELDPATRVSYFPEKFRKILVDEPTA